MEMIVRSLAVVETDESAAGAGVKVLLSEPVPMMMFPLDAALTTCVPMVTAEEPMAMVAVVWELAMMTADEEAVEISVKVWEPMVRTAAEVDNEGVLGSYWKKVLAVLAESVACGVVVDCAAPPSTEAT